MSQKQSVYDVIIIGGSYAGLSAAMALGRSMRQVLVIDSGKPCNRFTPHSHNFLTQDGEAPADISAKALEQVKQYDTVSFYHGLATSAQQESNGFNVETDLGVKFFGKRLILSEGIKDLLPDMPGFEECWGKSVIHCPYCHGYEFRGEKTGIWAGIDHAYHLAMLVKNLTTELSVFVQGEGKFGEDQMGKLRKHGIQVITSELESISHSGGQITAVETTDGARVALDALYASVPFTLSSDIPKTLGCSITESGHIEVDSMQKTNIPGVYACGDCTTPMRSVAKAVAGGNFAGAVANMELTAAEF